MEEWKILELKNVPSDLIQYRKRIDSSVQEQRKHRKIIEDIQNKLMKFRQKAAEAGLEAANSARGLGHGQSYPSLLVGDSSNENKNVCWTHQSFAFPSTSTDYTAFR